MGCFADLIVLGKTWTPTDYSTIKCPCALVLRTVTTGISHVVTVSLHMAQLGTQYIFINCLVDHRKVQTVHIPVGGRY